MPRETSFDIVLVGAGHNSLVAAAYLARAGKSVLVLERRDTVGGTAGTVEIEEGSPGGGQMGRFRASACFASAELFHPRIVRDLELERHGLELLTSRGGTFLPAAGAAGLHLPNGSNGAVAAAIGEQCSAADADAWSELDAFLGRLAAALEPVFTRPLPDLEEAGIRDVLDLVTLGWRMRSLGKKDLPEAMRFLPMPIQDVLDERLASEPLKAAIAGPALTSSWLGPRSAGSAYGLLHHRPAWGGGLFAPPAFPRGGLGALCEAIASSARQHGAEIRTGAAVETIVIEDGRATGVVLEDGEMVRTGTVVSGADPKTTLLRLADPSWLDPEYVFAVRNLRSRGTVAIVQLALDRLPRFEGAADGDARLAGRIQIGADLETLERAFDRVKYGELPSAPLLDITIPTLTDPSLAPAGKHVMHVWVQHAPYHLKDDWDEHRDALGDVVVGAIEALAPGFAESILARRVSTPADIERDFGLTGGCVYHVEPALDSALFLRPVAGWYQYRTPISGLYLCGPGTHPGGGVTGLPGKNAAAQILAD